MLFAVVPAWRAARQTVVTGLRQGGRLTQGAGRQRGRTLLACAQIALTLTLLTSAGLSLAALSRVTDGALGFEPAHVLTGQIALPAATYATPDSRRQFAERVIARLATLPAVTAVAVTNVLPYSGSDTSTRFWREDVPPLEADARQVSVRRVTPGLLPLLHVPLRAGRMLRDDDRHGSVEVALVSEGFAAHTWPNGQAVGRRFRMAADGPLIMVVGVVGNVVQDWLIDPLRPVLYRPLAQDPPSSLTVVAHTVTDPSQIAADLRAAVQAEDPNQPVTEVRSYETLIADHTFGLRFAGQTLTVMAVVSLLLATIGIYSLMSFITSRRTREIGLRLALGATRWDVIALTGGQALRLTGAGLAVGLVLALGAGKLLERAMFGSVTADMPLAFGLALLLGIVSTAASYIPAHRAATTDPTITLRAD
jgi:predicted permease